MYLILNSHKMPDVMCLLKLNEDQLRIMEVLGNNYQNKSSDYLIGSDNGITGVPYKNIMKNSGLNVEKTLLSLGYLEANGMVKHDCAIQRQTVEYQGRSDVEIAGQKIVRMFSLTMKGKDYFNKILS